LYAQQVQTANGFHWLLKRANSVKVPIEKPTAIDLFNKFKVNGVGSTCAKKCAFLAFIRVFLFFTAIKYYLKLVCNARMLRFSI